MTLKREINKLKDILAESGTYQGFLTSLSPEAWRNKTSGKASPNPKAVAKTASLSSVDSASEITEGLGEEEASKVLRHLDMTTEDLGSIPVLC